MKRKQKLNNRISIIIIVLLFIISNLKAQTPGQIIRDANGNMPPSGYSTVLDPNQNGYISVSTSGFSSSDIGSGNSEIPYVPVPLATSEVNADLRRGSSGSFSEIVPDAVSQGFYMYSDGTNIMFRMRIGGISPGSKGYSALLDVDQKFGASGVNADPTYQAQTTGTNGNPGFEFEVVYETNVDVAVYFIDNSCPTSPIKIKSYPVSTYPGMAQTSIASTSNGSTLDYFYDFYVPISDLNYGGYIVTSSTPIRASCTTVMSPSGAICGPKSDIYGNDTQFKSYTSQWEAEIINQPTFTLTDVGSTGSGIGSLCTAAPAVNTTINSTATSISGTWTKSSYSTKTSATITVYKNGTSIGTVSATSGSTWTLSSITVASGDVITAKAQATGESMCETSNGVTVAGCATASTSVCPTVTCFTDKGMEGTAITGATIRIYQMTTTGVTLVNTQTVDATGTIGWDGVSTTGTSKNQCNTGKADVTAGTYYVTQQESGKCESSNCTIYCVGGTAATAPVITQSTIYTSTSTLSGTATSGALIRLYINNTLKTTATATGGAYSFSLSSYYLNTSDVVAVTAQVASGCVSSSTTRTVQCVVSPPVITANTSSQISIGSQITGVSSEASGTTVTIYNAGTNTSVGTTTVSASGTWTLTSPTAASGVSYYATQTTSCGTSTQSATVTTQTATTSGCGTITSPVYENATSVSGTGYGTGTVRLLIDSVEIGSTTTTGSWTISGLSSGTIYTSGKLTTTFEETNKLALTCNGSVTVQCVSPASTYSVSSISPSTSGTGATSGNPYYITSSPVSITLNGSESGVLYTLENSSGVDQSTSKFGNGSSITFSSVTVPTTPQGSTFTWQVKATKLSGSCTETYVFVYFRINNSPVATNDATSANEDNAVTLNLVSNDTDADGTVNAATVDLDPSTTGIQTSYSNSQGTWSVNSSGVLTYTPTLNYFGTASITYTVNDNSGATSASGTVTITVNSVNDAPVANNDATSTNEDNAVTLSITSNDTDVDGTVNAATVDLDPSTSGRQTTYTNAAGTWTVDNSGNVTFTPTLNYNGTATASYTVNDNNGATSNTGTITITVISVNDAPVANNDATSTNEDTPVTFSITSNDTDVDGTVNAATVDLDPSTVGRQTTYTNAAGTWTVDNSGNVTFTPALNYNGTATASYTVNDNNGATSNTGTITITVISVNDAPVANNDATSTNEDTPVTFSITSNDTDVDGTVNAATVDLDPSTVGRQTTYTNAAGTWTVDNSGNVTFTPALNYNGTATASYTVNDNNGATSNTGTITITVISVNDAPVANNDATSTNEDNAVTLSVTSNDTDVDGTVNAATVDLDPSTAGRQTTYTNAAGTWTVDNSGNVTFTPALNYNGTATASYTVNDNNGATSNTGTITITVISVNDAPVANNDATSTNEDTPVTFSITSNDTDVDGTVNASTVDLDPSTAGRQTTYTNAAGTWTVDNSGNVTFTPALNYNGTATASYTVNDNNGATSNTATITITVNSVNDAPVANNDATSTNEDNAVTFSVTSNDTDVDGTINAATVDLDPSTAGRQTTYTNAAGTWTVDNSGNVTFTPALNYNGTATASYTVNDNNGATSNTGTITITVISVNDAPVANNDATSTNEDTPVTFSITSNDTDVDGTVNAATVDLDPSTSGTQTTYTDAAGTWTVDNSGNVTFTPALNYNGTATASYTVNDNDGTISNTGIITITVNSVNDAPFATNDATSTNEDNAVILDITTNDTDIDGTIDAATVDLDPSTAGRQTTYTNTAGTWTVNNAGNLTFTPALNYNGTATINYTIEDNDGTVSNAAVIEITVNPYVCTLSAVVVQNGTILCNGGTTTVTVFANDGKAPYTGTGVFTVGAGTYTYTVTDAKNCTASATVTITEPPALSASASVSGIIPCGGGSVTVTVTGNGGAPPYNGTGSFTVTSAGSYNYTVTDANGCTATASVTVSQVPVYIIAIEPAANATVSPSGNIPVCSGGNLTINITPDLGYEIVDVKIDNLSQGPLSSYTFTNITSAHTVKIITRKLCVASSLSAVITTSNCEGTSGAIDLVLTGGTGPFTYSWTKAGSSFSANTEDISGVSSGTYNVAVTATGGCQSFGSYSIGQLSPSVWYLDADNDGYYVGDSIVACTSPGTGYRTFNIISKGDCDDNNRLKWRTGSFYIDGDMDGYNAGVVTICYGNEIPIGYVSTTKGTDCDDNNAAAWSVNTFYRDADLDGFGDPNKSITICYSKPPNGYVTDNTDCNDADRLNAGPTQPARISVSRRNACDTVVTYSVKRLKTAAGYDWVIPSSGTIIQNRDTAIVVRYSIPVYSGTVSVTAYNNCGRSGPSTISVDSKPARPAVTGPTCISSTATGLVYTAPADPEVVNYIWTVAAPAQITAGQGTRSITVNWNKSGGARVRTEAFNTCGNSNKDSIFVKINCTTLSVLNQEQPADNKTSLQVYPNPAGNLAYVTFSNSKAGKYTVVVADNSGRQLLSKTGIALEGDNKETLDLRNLTNGSYIVTLISSQGKQSIKLVKEE